MSLLPVSPLDVVEIVSRYRQRQDLNLIFDFRLGVYHRLDNEVAKDMFALAKAGHALPQIIDTIAEEYEAPRDVIEQDAVAFFTSISTEASSEVPTEWYTVDKGFTDPLKFPLRMEIELTSMCNWNCGFCYNVWKIDPDLSDREVRQKIKQFPAKHIPKELAFQILDECAEQGCMVMRYSGGETMLHPDAMEIFRYGGSLGMYQTVFTNGHFVSPTIAQEFADANVKTVLISIHGDRETQNKLAGHRMAYDKSMSAMSDCLAVGIDVVAECTLVADNVDGVLDIMRDVYSRGVCEFRVMRYVPTGKNDEQYAVPQSLMFPLMEAIENLKAAEMPDMKVGWPCGQKFCTSADDMPLPVDDPTMQLRFEQLTGHCESGLVWGSISFDGKVRNCPHSNMYFGDAKDGLQGAWDQMTAAVAAAVAPRDSCGGCSVAGLCKGGCHLPHFIEDEAAVESGGGCGTSSDSITLLTIGRKQAN